jgi:hypothetical protein
MLRCFDTMCSDPPDPTGDLDFSIALAGRDSNLSAPITLKSRAVVHRPGGAYDPSESDQINNELFQTVRIPLTAFTGVDRTSFRGVRFTFDRTKSSSIFLANVRLTMAAAADTEIPEPDRVKTVSDTGGFRPDEGLAPAPEAAELNEAVAIRRIMPPDGRRSSAREGLVEIELASTRPFHVGNALPELKIGRRTFTLSRYPSGSTDRLVFFLEPSQFEASEEGADVTLHMGGRRPWRFGPLNKGFRQ